MKLYSLQVLFSADLRRFKDLKEDAIKPFVGQKTKKLKVESDIDDKIKKQPVDVVDKSMVKTTHPYIEFTLNFDV